MKERIILGCSNVVALIMTFKIELTKIIFSTSTLFVHDCQQYTMQTTIVKGTHEVSQGYYLALTENPLPLFSSPLLLELKALQNEIPNMDPDIQVRLRLPPNCTKRCLILLKICDRRYLGSPPIKLQMTNAISAFLYSRCHMCR